MVHTAAAFAKMHNRLRDARMHHVDRPRRDQHDHRRGRRDDQSRAGAAAAGRHLRRAAVPIRCCSSSNRASSQRRVGQRLLQAGVAILGSDQSAGAVDLVVARSDARVDVSGRHRRGDDRLCRRTFRRRRSTIPPRSSSRGSGPFPGTGRTATAVANAARAIRAAQRPLLIAGGGVLYSEATDALAAFARATGVPVAETQAGKGALPFDHPQAVGGDRGHRNIGGEPSRDARPTSSSPSAPG